MDGQNRICWVVFPQRDGIEPLGGELALARRRFLTDPKHAVSVDREQNVKGFKGRVKGRIGKRRFFWRLRATGASGGEISLEEAFGSRDGWTVVVRDMYGVIVSRSFFDKQHQWLRTEYYEPWNPDQAKVTFSPGAEPGSVLRRDWDPELKTSRDTTLYTVPYRPGAASQSVVDAQLGEPQLLLVMTEGELCCCPKEEAKARQEAMKNVNSGTVVLMPAWEIKGGELVREDGGDGDPGISFTSLEEYAKIEPGSPEKPQPALTGEALPQAGGQTPAMPAAQPAPAPRHLDPLPESEFVPQRGDMTAELPLIEPHEARHMQEHMGPVNYEELIDAPVEPMPAAPAVPAAPVPQPPCRMEPEPLIPELLGSAAAPQYAPTQAAPTQVTPAQSAPAQAAPAHYAPVQAAPGPAHMRTQPPAPAPEQVPEAVPSAQFAPTHATPPQASPAQIAPAQFAPTHGTPPQASPAQITPAHYAHAPVPEPVSEPEQPAHEENPEGDANIEAILAEAALYGKAPPLPEASPETAEGKAIPSGYTGDIKNGKITGRGRTEQRSGLTSYEGDYVDGRRQGFGTYYYRDGNLCYAGNWRDDRREGLGVSFRDGDHAMHVANWKDGQPQGLVTLFDSEGNLRFSGRMENGKKEGAGVTISADDGTVFVGQWSSGEATGLGSAFDRDGRLLYYGGWKEGKRHGHGTEFDVNGGVVFDGEFRDGKYYNGVLYQKM